MRSQVCGPRRLRASRDMRVSDLCPRACGLCGVVTPSHCTMRVIEGDAATTSIDEVIETLLTSTTPIVVKWSVAIALEMRRLLAVHQSMRVAVVPRRPLPRRRHGREAHSLRRLCACTQNRSGRLHLLRARWAPGTATAMGSRIAELAGPEVSPEARLDSHQVWSSAWPLLRRTNELSPHAMDGRLSISRHLGNGRPFHAHGPAPSACIWLEALVRTAAECYLEWQRWAGRICGRARHCQRAGRSSCGSAHKARAIWCGYHQLHHATLNYASEVIGFAMVMDDAETFTPLHTAAQSGAADERRCYGAVTISVTVAAANGATPLHFASGLGHCEGVEVHLGAGADVDVKAAQG